MAENELKLRTRKFVVEVSVANTMQHAAEEKCGIRLKKVGQQKKELTNQFSGRVRFRIRKMAPKRQSNHY